MDLLIDLSWLLEIQDRCMTGSEVDVTDFSVLEAAVARHRCTEPRLGLHPDHAWRAAALFVEIVRGEPLPRANPFYASMVVAHFMHTADEGIDPPYGALPALVRDVRSYKADIWQAADLIRSWCL